MTQQEILRDDVFNSQVNLRANRAKHDEDMELLIASAEAGIMCAEWVLDHRDQTERHMS